MCMKILTNVLMLTVAGSGCVAMMGCQVDDSLPRRPRVAVPADQERSRENAEKRVLENPKRDLPTGGREFPGQSNALPKGDRSVTFLTDMYGKRYSGLLPHLAVKPGTTSTPGFTPVAGTGMAVDHSWGEVLPLADYNHRPWPDTQTNYLTSGVQGNPTYYVNGADAAGYGAKQGPGYAAGAAVIEVPWFYLNTAALPVLMVLQCPWSQTSPQRLGQDANYFGYLPATGAVIPAPTTGE